MPVGRVRIRGPARTTRAGPRRCPAGRRFRRQRLLSRRGVSAPGRAPVPPRPARERRRPGGLSRPPLPFSLPDGARDTHRTPECLQCSHGKVPLVDHHARDPGPAVSARPSLPRHTAYGTRTATRRVGGGARGRRAPPETTPAAGDRVAGDGAVSNDGGMRGAPARRGRTVRPYGRRTHRRRPAVRPREPGTRVPVTGSGHD